MLLLVKCLIILFLSHREKLFWSLYLFYFFFWYIHITCERFFVYCHYWYHKNFQKQRVFKVDLCVRDFIGVFFSEVCCCFLLSSASLWFKRNVPMYRVCSVGWELRKKLTNEWKSLFLMTEYNGSLISYCILSSGKLVTHIIRFCCINYKWNKQFCHHGVQWIHHMLYVNILVICLLFMCHRNPFPSLCSSYSLRVLTKVISTLPVQAF